MDTSRRRLIGAGSAGIVAMGLPSAASATSLNDDVDSQSAASLEAPTNVTATPIGYVSGGTTGAIRVTWTEVSGATYYQVDYSTTENFSVLTTSQTSGAETTLDLTGLTSATTYFIRVRAHTTNVLSANSTTVSASSVIATGGTVTTFEAASTRYVVHTFNASSTFTLNRNDIGVEYLIVGGGGGGGSRHGGGGGAGGVRTQIGSASPRGAIPHEVVVGAGGAGVGSIAATGSQSTPTSGGASSVFGVEAAGGGRGDGAGGNASSGGSGGGSASSGRPIGLGNTPAVAPAQGSDGGQGFTGSGEIAWAGGGGGGSGAAGSAASGDQGGSGGAGISSSITNEVVVYAGGGGGASTNRGLGGSGGGGNGGTASVSASAGAANTGGGGGGGHLSGDMNLASGDGGSGVVILRYAITPPAVDAPTNVTATPIGYVSGSSTGAIRVSWTAASGATSYEVVSSANADFSSSTTATVTGATSRDYTGLAIDAIRFFKVRASDSTVTSVDSAAASSPSVIATGGTVSTFLDGSTRYAVHSFTSTGSSTFRLNRSMDVEHLIVGGGGGGGSRHGGGGGAGGLRTSVGSATSRSAGPWTVVVGAGGAGTPEHLQSSIGTNDSSKGSPSSVFGVESEGGGRGGGSINGNGGSGGSGGGSSGASGAAGSGTTGQGNAGAKGTDNPWAGGGGGGAGSAGVAAVVSGSNANAGNGGAGIANSITGPSVTYAGGGGGSSPTGSQGAGGSGGGGAGTNSSSGGTNATANTGGGGGGGGFGGSPDTNYKGGNGGSGVVIVRYAIPA